MHRGNKFLRLVLATAGVAGCATTLWFAAPTVTNWYQERQAARLLEQVEAAGENALRAPLQELRELGAPGIGALVGAAASRRPEVARAARLEVQQEMTLWLVKASASQKFDYLERVHWLARELAIQIEEFDQVGKRWCGMQALGLIRQAEQIPAEESARLLAHCEYILAVVSLESPQEPSPAPTVAPR